MDEIKFLRDKLNNAIKKKINRKKLRPSDAIGTLSLDKFDKVFVKNNDDIGEFEKKVLKIKYVNPEKILSIDDL